MFVPELKSALAKARSERGNHCATVLMAAGKLPPSPTPRATRAQRKPETEPTNAWAAAAADQAKIETA